MMTRELTIENLLNTYGKYGITEKDIIPNIGSGLDCGLNMTAIYLGLDMVFAQVFGVNRYYSPADLAEAFECSIEEIYASASDFLREVEANGGNRNDYLLKIPDGDPKYAM